MTILHQWRFWTMAAVLCSNLGADPAPATKTPPAVFSDEKPAAPAKLQPLNKQGTVVLDKTTKRLLLKGRICLKKGALELLLPSFC